MPKAKERPPLGGGKPIMNSFLGDYRKETDDPVIVKRLPLESLHICRPIGELANWLEAAPTIVEVELECDGVDGEFDFEALKHVLAAKTKLVRLLITDWRMNAVELARRGPD